MTFLAGDNEPPQVAAHLQAKVINISTVGPLAYARGTTLPPVLGNGNHFHSSVHAPGFSTPDEILPEGLGARASRAHFDRRPAFDHDHEHGHEHEHVHELVHEHGHGHVHEYVNEYGPSN